MDRTFGSRSPFPRNLAFVVQFSADAESGGFNGRVEHVLSGKAVQFRSPRALLEFLKASLPAQTSQAGQEVEDGR